MDSPIFYRQPFRARGVARRGGTIYGWSTHSTSVDSSMRHTNPGTDQFRFSEKRTRRPRFLSLPLSDRIRSGQSLRSAGHLRLQRSLSSSPQRESPRLPLRLRRLPQSVARLVRSLRFAPFLPFLSQLLIHRPQSFAHSSRPHWGASRPLGSAGKNRREWGFLRTENRYLSSTSGLFSFRRKTFPPPV
jgi:hypothetical protein